MAMLGNVTAHLAMRNHTAVLQPHLCEKKGKKKENDFRTLLHHGRTRMSSQHTTFQT